MQFIGHVINREVIAVDSLKFKIVLSWEIQRVVDEVRNFLGHGGNYI